MTTPEERLRNLLWGAETLAELLADQTLPAEIRNEAAELLRGYPSAERIQLCTNSSDFWKLKNEFSALAAAKKLFQRAQYHPSSSEQLRRELMVVLRHFD